MCKIQPVRCTSFETATQKVKFSLKGKQKSIEKLEAVHSCPNDLQILIENNQTLRPLCNLYSNASITKKLKPKN